MTPKWLSHHHESQLNRCYRIGGYHVCARCLGTYPVLFAALAIQTALRLTHPLPSELAAVLALTLPATLDWAVGQFRPERGSNQWRSVTGVLLGLALGRSLFLHLVHPFPPVLVAQLAMVILIALPVILIRYRPPSGR